MEGVVVWGRVGRSWDGLIQPVVLCGLRLGRTQANHSVFVCHFLKYVVGNFRGRRRGGPDPELPEQTGRFSAVNWESLENECDLTPAPYTTDQASYP